MVGTVLKSEALYYRAGTSDKAYKVHLEEVEGGFLVAYEFGKRGSNLRRGLKTKAPLERAAAEKVFEKLVASQLKDGYVRGTGEAGFVPEDRTLEVALSSCQLLNPIDADGVDAYLDDPAFGAQEKMNGKRLRVGRERGEVYATNRSGQRCTFPKAIADAVAPIPGGDFLLDGEQVGESYCVFDVVLLDGQDLRGQGFFERHCTATGVLMPYASDVLKNVPVSLAAADKRALFADVEARGAEGVVFKRLDAPYVAGRPNSGGDQLKYKFRDSCTVRVAAHNEDRRSVAIELQDDAGVWIGIGNVTVPANQEIPAVGTLVEVEYLHAHEGGGLSEVVLLGARDDLDEADCRLSQLKMRPAAV
jgi:bifunctional non-homologous end joining protein LigD